jgi:UDP-glucuronate decarboxylase
MSVIHEDVIEIISKENIAHFRNKKILVTGASGLVGSYFAVFFQTINETHAGNIDLYLGSHSGNFLIPILKNTNVIIGSLYSTGSLDQFNDFDIIIHAAGYAQPSKFLSEPIETIRLNVEVTIELTKKLAKDGVLLYLSSSEVYAGLLNPPFSESEIGNSNTNHIRAPYIEAKRCGEVIVSTHNKLNLGSRAVAVRLSLAYGPGTRHDDSRVLSNFITQGISAGNIHLRDPGTAWRTYCYVKDAISQMVTILISGTEELYNVGGESRIQIVELAKLVANLTGAKLFVPTEGNQFQSGAPEDVSLDLTRVKKIWNQSDFTDLSEGVNKTIVWAQNLKLKGH